MSGAKPGAKSGAKSLLRHTVAPAIAAAFVIAIPLVSPTTPGQAPGGWTPMAPVAVSYDVDAARRRLAKGRLLGFNDFHGALEPPAGSGGLVNGTPAGGAEYLATHVKRLRAAGAANGREGHHRGRR